MDTLHIRQYVKWYATSETLFFFFCAYAQWIFGLYVYDQWSIVLLINIRNKQIYKPDKLRLQAIRTVLRHHSYEDLLSNAFTFYINRSSYTISFLKASIALKSHIMQIGAKKNTVEKPQKKSSPDVYQTGERRWGTRNEKEDPKFWWEDDSTAREDEMILHKDEENKNMIIQYPMRA